MMNRESVRQFPDSKPKAPFMRYRFNTSQLMSSRNPYAPPLSKATIESSLSVCHSITVNGSWCCFLSQRHNENCGTNYANSYPVQGSVPLPLEHGMPTAGL